MQDARQRRAKPLSSNAFGPHYTGAVVQPFRFKRTPFRIHPPVRPLAWKAQVSCRAFANAGPETLEARPCFIWATLGQPRGKQDCVDGARTGPAHGIEFEIILLE